MRSGAALLATVLVAVALTVGEAGAGAEEAPTYRAPVDRAVVDPFRRPATPYGPGNRGLDYATERGETVTAAADGEVVFAGTVGTGRHVVVLHGDGIRTSYSFLAGIDVRRGDTVRQGDPVGTAGGTGLHFGARAGDRYVDPALLLAQGTTDVHLVPTGPAERASEAAERQGLLRQLAGLVVGALADTADVAWDVVWTQLERYWTQLVVLSAYVQEFQVPGLVVLRQWRRMQPFLASQARCTPAGTAPPAPPGERRIAVLVGGFGTSGGRAAVLGVDTGALGYAPEDVVQFSYAGGRVPGVGALEGVPTSEYGPAEANGDLRESGRRLRRLLEDIRAAHPGVAIDVVAHSQGGVVARQALGEPGDGSDPRIRVDHLITLGSPHHGTDLATATTGLATTTLGTITAIGVDVATEGRLDASSPAAAQLAETSAFVDDLEDRPLPPGTAVTSIAATGDLVVPALQSSLDGATNAVVDLVGPDAHTDLPGDERTTRELALALAGRPPTCNGDVATDLAGAAALSVLEDGIGLALLAPTAWFDARVPVPVAGR